MTETQEIFTLMGGAIKMYRSEYNPTSDAVWLAAFPDTNPTTILDVGIGTGGVSLCLQHHFPNAHITGLDSAQNLLDICDKNARLNGYEFELINQDIFTWSTPTTYDLVVSNPPYFQGTPRNKNPQTHHNSDLGRWIQRCIARVRPMGTFCTIVDAGRLSEVISVMSKSFGLITIFPLFGNKQTAERVLIRGILGNHGQSTIYSGLPMNYEPILRNGLTIGKILSKIPEQ